VKFIELYKEQKLNDTSIYDSKIMHEYYGLYRYLSNIQFKNEEIVQRVQKSLDNITTEDFIEILKTAELLKRRITSLFSEIDLSFANVMIKGFILLIGDGISDGHGIIVDGEPYVVFDLMAVFRGIENYNLDELILHESIHSIHYYLNEEMYFKNHNTIQDQYFKRMIVEGIATYISGSILSSQTEDEYWLGFFYQEQTQKWKANCEHIMDSVSSRLETSILKEEIDIDLYYSLFSVVDPDNLVDSRLAYYYGTKISEKVSKDHTFDEMLRINGPSWNNHIREYFNFTGRTL